MLELILAGALASACHPVYVVVPEPRDGYSSRDTLHGRLKGKDVRVSFHFDTTYRTDTVTRWRTIYREGARVDTVVVVDPRVPDGPSGPGVRRRTGRIDTVFVVVHDTVRAGNYPRRPGERIDTVRIVVHDTIRVADPRRPGTRVDTVRIVVHDTVRVTDPRRPGTPGTPGGPVVMPRPPVEGRIDTVRITIHDTVRVVVHDTVRVGGGGGEGEGGGGREGEGHGARGRPRSTMIPPGQYPPAGLCRLWIAGTPPGQQARPARCDALGAIPAGAFILFNNRVWDADYDYARSSDAANVPPEILAISRQRFP